MEKYKVLIIGGGPAGLSAALALGRMHIKTLVVDSNKPRNLKSHHLNNFPTRDGINPSEWRKLAKADISKYSDVSFIQNEVIKISRNEDYFDVELKNTQKIKVKKVLLATGVKDILPEIEGIQELWGEHVFHCPFCHGHEMHNKKIAYLGNEEMAKHMLPMLWGLSHFIQFFTNGEEIQDENFLKNLEAKKIEVNTREIKKISFNENLLIEGEGFIQRSDGMFVALKLPVTQSTSLIENLNLEKDDFGFIKTNEFHETSIKGIFAVGDNMSGKHSVLLSSASGSFAASMVVKEIVQEKFYS